MYVFRTFLSEDSLVDSIQHGAATILQLLIPGGCDGHYPFRPEGRRQATNCWEVRRSYGREGCARDGADVDESILEETGKGRGDLKLYQLERRRRPHTSRTRLLQKSNSPLQGNTRSL